MRSQLQNLYLNPVLRTLIHQYGPSVWRLPRPLRQRMCGERGIPRLPNTRTWPVAAPEAVTPQKPIPDGKLENLGHRLAAMPYTLPRSFVAEVPNAWLVGEHATPFTGEGRMLLTAFRDQPNLLGLEPRPDLSDWISRKGGAGKPSRREEAPLCSLVNRLDPNYFHWIVEWCAQIEGLLRYEQATGTRPKVLIRANGPRYLRPSLELLGFGGDSVREWEPEQGPLGVASLVVPSLPGNRVACSPRSLRWLRERFLKASGVSTEDLDDTGANEKIYIARRAGGWRSVVNEEEVREFLRNRGFRILSAENLTLAEQIRVFSRAKLIVGLHGSGLTNVLFAPWASVLELFGTYGDGVFYSMTACLEQPYASLMCPPVGDDVRVDLHQLEQKLALFSERR